MSDPTRCEVCGALYGAHFGTCVIGMNDAMSFDDGFGPYRLPDEFDDDDETCDFDDEVIT